jgi:hypothetical protein
MKTQNVALLTLPLLALISSGLAYGPPHTVKGQTTVYQIGRVCTYGHPLNFLTLVFDYCPGYYGPTVILTGPRPAYQHWVKVFNADLSRQNKFHIVSFPRLDYVLKVTTVRPLGAPLGSSSVIITAVKLPTAFYVHGWQFRQLGSEYTFQDTVSSTDGTISGTWNYVKHVQTGFYLDCLINHPAQCGKSYAPVVLSSTTYSSTIGNGTCTCSVDRKQWRYFD